MKSHLLIGTAIIVATITASAEAVAQERPLRQTPGIASLPVEGTAPSFGGATT